ncbi:pre-60S factor REI1, partial [Lecanoromycetidae sp. Uapishka_2]
MATIAGSRSTANGPQPAAVSNVAHRYNLKRKIAELKPLSYEHFAEKVLNAQASSSAVAAKASFEKSCEACQKKYYSENAYQNHLGSQKHRLRVAVLAKDGKITTDDETASLISSTMSLGEPINRPIADVKAPESIDQEVEAEFSKVVDGIKETSLNEERPATEEEPVSRRPTRPHHSSNEQRSEHPLSPQKDPNNIISSTVDETSQPLMAPLNKCLFCNYDSPTFKLNVNHMGKFHGLFIPEQIYLIDLEGLISWLHSKIVNMHECLYCHKIKGSAEGIQTHMRDKGHCMIAFEAEEDMIEVGQFYDFSSTYSDPEEDDDDAIMEDFISETNGGVKIDPRKVLKTVISDENGDQEMTNGDENGEGWETDSSASSLDSADVTAIPIEDRHEAYERMPKHRHHSHKDPRPHRNIDGFHSHAHSHNNAAFHSDYELHLPSGRTAGHRSLQRYYRQNLHSYPTPAERVEQQRLIADGTADDEGDQQMADSNERGRQLTTRVNGGQGMLGVTDAKKREVQAVEKRDTKRAQRAERKFEWGVNKQANSQKHFRDPLLQ